MSNRPSSSKTGHRGAGPSSARVARARQADSGSGRWWIIGGVAVVAVAALVIAVIVSTRSDPSTVGVAAAGFDLSPDAPPDLIRGTVKVNGTPLAEMPQAVGSAEPDDPAVGQAVPEVVGQRFDGKEITIPASGTPKVVMFVAHWCPHCQKEVPVITAHLGGTLPAGVDLYAVSTGMAEDKPNFPPGDWLRRESWPVPTLVDDGNSSAARAYGLSGYPFFVAVDTSGKVVKRASGELTTDQFDALAAAARAGGSAGTSAG